MAFSEIFNGTLLLISIAFISGSLLLLSARRWRENTSDIIFKVAKLLPQTQCAQCGYPGCRPYAEAILEGEAINKCPPGGDSTIASLALLLGREVSSLDESCGTGSKPVIAEIREAECIGCTLCIQACPVDAIIGAAQMMHTVISNECTGCELCLPPCPVDCIDINQLHDPDNFKNQIKNQIPPQDHACIHCDLCIKACPKDLAPQQLLLYGDTVEIAESLGLFDCIECRICDAVCPSGIALTATFQDMKRTVYLQKEATKMAEYAELRFNRRETRLIANTASIRHRPSKADTAALLADIKGDS
jgi:electron transport complex protein RnfB